MEYFLCGGVMFFLLKQAAISNATPRDHMRGQKDDHSEPILMRDLIYTFTRDNMIKSAKDTSKYKECLIEGSINIPFNDIVKCTVYENLVRDNYATAIERMDEFVARHLNSEMAVWLVKALLEIIECDTSIKDSVIFYIKPDGNTATKTEIKTIEDYDLSAFLVGVLHYILCRRDRKNSGGKKMLASIGIKKKRKSRKYTGNLGITITRKINVAFLPNREGEHHEPADRKTPEIPEIQQHAELEPKLEEYI